MEVEGALRLKAFDGQQFFSGPASSFIGQADALSGLTPDGFSLAGRMKNVTDFLSSATSAACATRP